MTYDWEAQISTIGTRLVPSLHSSANRAHNDGEVERERVFPLVRDLEAQRLALIIQQAIDMVEITRILRDQSPSLDKLDMLRQTLVFAKGFDIAHQVAVGDVRERVGDS